MKNLFLLALLFLCYTVKSQIQATTSAGQKVILNMDGTWKYANGASATQDCITYSTANVTIVNNSNYDIYFYYAVEGQEYYPAKSFSIKAKSSRQIDNLPTNWPAGNGGDKFVYKWVASNEFYPTGTELRKVKGFENNSFTLTNCQPYTVNVGN